MCIHYTILYSIYSLPYTQLFGWCFYIVLTQGTPTQHCIDPRNADSTMYRHKEYRLKKMQTQKELRLNNVLIQGTPTKQCCDPRNVNLTMHRPKDHRLNIALTQQCAYRRLNKTPTQWTPAQQSTDPRNVDSTTCIDPWSKLRDKEHMQPALHSTVENI